MGATGHPVDLLNWLLKMAPDERHASRLGYSFPFEWMPCEQRVAFLGERERLAGNLHCVAQHWSAKTQPDGACM